MQKLLRLRIIKTKQRNRYLPDYQMFATDFLFIPLATSPFSDEALRERRSLREMTEENSSESKKKRKKGEFDLRLMALRSAAQYNQKHLVSPNLYLFDPKKESSHKSHQPLRKLYHLKHVIWNSIFLYTSAYRRLRQNVKSPIFNYKMKKKLKRSQNKKKRDFKDENEEKQFLSWANLLLTGKEKKATSLPFLAWKRKQKNKITKRFFVRNKKKREVHQHLLNPGRWGGNTFTLHPAGLKPYNAQITVDKKLWNKKKWISIKNFNTTFLSQYTKALKRNIRKNKWPQVRGSHFNALKLKNIFSVGRKFVRNALVRDRKIYSWVRFLENKTSADNLEKIRVERPTIFIRRQYVAWSQVSNFRRRINFATRYLKVIHEKKLNLQNRPALWPRIKWELSIFKLRFKIGYPKEALGNHWLHRSIPVTHYQSRKNRDFYSICSKLEDKESMVKTGVNTGNVFDYNLIKPYLSDQKNKINIEPTAGKIFKAFKKQALSTTINGFNKKDLQDIKGIASFVPKYIYQNRKFYSETPLETFFRNYYYVKLNTKQKQFLKKISWKKKQISFIDKQKSYLRFDFSRKEHENEATKLKTNESILNIEKTSMLRKGIVTRQKLKNPISMFGGRNQVIINERYKQLKKRWMSYRLYQSFKKKMEQQIFNKFKQKTITKKLSVRMSAQVNRERMLSSYINVETDSDFKTTWPKTYHQEHINQLWVLEEYELPVPDDEEEDNEKKEDEKSNPENEEEAKKKKEEEAKKKKEEEAKKKKEEEEAKKKKEEEEAKKKKEEEEEKNKSIVQRIIAKKLKIRKEKKLAKKQREEEEKKDMENAPPLRSYFISYLEPHITEPRYARTVVTVRGRPLRRKTGLPGKNARAFARLYKSNFLLQLYAWNEDKTVKIWRQLMPYGLNSPYSYRWRRLDRRSYVWDRHRRRFLRWGPKYNVKVLTRIRRGRPIKKKHLRHLFKRPQDHRGRSGFRAISSLCWRRRLKQLRRQQEVKRRKARALTWLNRQLTATYQDAKINLKTGEIKHAVKIRKFVLRRRKVRSFRRKKKLKRHLEKKIFRWVFYLNKNANFNNSSKSVKKKYNNFYKNEAKSLLNHY